MTSLDQLKKEIKEEASDNPEKFFATEVLREKDFKRAQCENCGMYFWRADEDRTVCGEPECSGGYTFINDSPTNETFSYIESWELYSNFMEERGYKIIDRYPVVARWRDDVEFVGAAIYNFQPYVVSGEAEPPAEELCVPQPSLRFNDIDNVGVTGRHYVMHDHISQTCFKKADEYDQDRYFRDLFEFAVDELGIPRDKLILHEDSWGGGGNLGACMEFFVDGLELWNQVYMFYEVTPEGYEELDLKVLDMGMGHERITWISHGTETSYECVMPHVLDNMKSRTGIEVDQETWEGFLPHSSLLNVDEVDDIDEKWREIADEMGVEVEHLKDEIKPVSALYAVAEHGRALLFALADGKLPSNTGGGHDLRVIFRRSMNFIDKYDWDLDMKEVVEWNAEELEPMFPGLKESLEDIKKIIEVEEEKYRESKKKAEEKLAKVSEEPSVERMIELYESHGVSKEMMEQRGFKVPEDFYSRVASKDEKQEEVKDRFDLEEVPETEKLYYQDEKQKEFEAEVTAVRGDYVALSETAFYPEGGGQEPDHGKLTTVDGSVEVVDVQEQDGVVLHKVPEHDLEKGDDVRGRIDWERRLQLMQHHSMTHAVNGAAVELLGEHIYQAGAHKTVEKGRLDITHYEKLDRETLDQLEGRVRRMIIEDHDINKREMQKTEAEQKYGFRIYQGGAAPGNTLRVVEIDGVDVEACGGTHLDSTSEAEEFVITSSTKVQDGVIRLNYKAGEAAEKYVNQVKNRVNGIADMLGAEEADNHREAQRELCGVFSVEPEQLEDTVEKFLEENDELHHEVVKLSQYLDEDVDMPGFSGEGVVEKAESLFNCWKKREKLKEGLEQDIEHHIRENMEDRKFRDEVPTDNVGLMIQVVRKLAKGNSAAVTLFTEKGGVAASYHEEVNADEELSERYENVQGDDNFAKAFN